jgi:urease accessory protein
MLLAVAGEAQAHHLMGGVTPSTFVEGLLSGLGHPIIGIDHLAILVALGLTVGMFGLSLVMPLVFIGASVLGVGLHVLGANLPESEVLIAASVICGGILVLRGTKLHAATWASLFIISGLSHGYAFGESIFGAEPTPLWAYLAGLALIQGAIAVGIALIARGRLVPGSLAPRVAGSLIFAVGIFVLGSQILP